MNINYSNAALSKQFVDEIKSLTFNLDQQKIEIDLI
jgi:hypothetical protein